MNTQSRNKREGRYTGNKDNMRSNPKNARMSYKRFNKDYFYKMAYVHWQDGVVNFHPLFVEVLPGFFDDE